MTTPQTMPTDPSEQVTTGETLPVVLEIPERVDPGGGVDWFKPPPGPGNPAYSASVAAEILRKHASGETLKAILSAEGMPSHTCFNYWRSRSPSLDAAWQRARMMFAETLVEGALEAADEAKDKDNAQAAKVKADTRLRIAAMVDPAKWSERRSAPKTGVVVIATNIGQPDNAQGTPGEYRVTIDLDAAQQEAAAQLERE